MSEFVDQWMSGSVAPSDTNRLIERVLTYDQEPWPGHVGKGPTTQDCQGPDGELLQQALLRVYLEGAPHVVLDLGAQAPHLEQRGDGLLVQVTFSYSSLLLRMN